ncbi:MAG: hypothetical protein D6729_08090 [Deltaproteobacteria bacterium]|nr:MAG: hypothetical protein D6729_08090 [Deltaproteobacteria bacterium]
MRALVLIVALGAVAGASASPRHEAFDLETARTLRPGAVTIGVFAPLRWGVSETVELSTHPLWNLLIPNVAAKFALPGSSDWDVALEFGLTHPTPLLHVLSKEGTGGVLPADASVPDLVTLDVRALFTYRISRHHALTLRFGGRSAEAFGPRRFPTIDYPFAYGPTAPYVVGFAMDGTVAVTGRLVGSLYYRADLTAYVIPRPEGPLTLEHSAAAYYRFGEHWQAKLGYKVVFGKMPYGDDLTPPLPMLDLEYAF